MHTVNQELCNVRVVVYLHVKYENFQPNTVVSFDLSLPTCAQGNVSDDLETATLILQCKNWA